MVNVTIYVILKTENIPKKKETSKELACLTVRNVLENRGPSLFIITLVIKKSFECGIWCLAETRLQRELSFKNKKEESNSSNSALIKP